MRRSPRPDDGSSDGELVGLYRAGSADAGEILARRHWPRAWRAAYAVLASRAEAEDAAQSATERAFAQIARFDTQRPFGPWLARIAANQALNVLRARRREQPLPEEQPVGDLYAEIVDRDEVMNAVALLSEDQRVVVVLRYWADLSPPEIAEVIGSPVGTVASRLSRALTALRETLGEVAHP